MEVGLAEYVEPQYLRFDPALLATDLTAEEREVQPPPGRKPWQRRSGFSTGKRRRWSLANNLTLLGNHRILAALNRLADGAPERLTHLRQSGGACRRHKLLVLSPVIVEIRTAAARRLSSGSHGCFRPERYRRCVDRPGTPCRSGSGGAGTQHEGRSRRDSPYEGAAYDLALVGSRSGAHFGGAETRMLPCQSSTTRTNASSAWVKPGWRRRH